MNMMQALEPKSDQMNAEDLLAGPRTFTITDVKVAPAGTEQPIRVYLAEFPADRPWKPSKTMGRVLVAAWGEEESAYIGHRVTLFRDPEITFGKDKVGGIRISHLSHIDKQIRVNLTSTRGKRAMHIIEPLPELSKREQLKAEWKSATPERRAAIEAEVAQLGAESC